jgi:lipoprotein-anchoring transpeptidase ErfK/SrfK
VSKPVTPKPLPPTDHTGKQIIVDLSDQWLYALEGDRIIFDAPVSTGRDGFNTPIGHFSIYAKVREQTMRGCAGGECWVVPRVPHAMYIVGGVALHGTYWHNQFGTGVRRSHGCINLPLKAAAWLYDWAPVGTPVTVRR